MCAEADLERQRSPGCRRHGETVVAVPADRVLVVLRVEEGIEAGVDASRSATTGLPGMAGRFSARRTVPCTQAESRALRILDVHSREVDGDRVRGPMGIGDVEESEIRHLPERASASSRTRKSRWARVGFGFLIGDGRLRLRPRRWNRDQQIRRDDEGPAQVRDQRSARTSVRTVWSGLHDSVHARRRTSCATIARSRRTVRWSPRSRPSRSPRIRTFARALATGWLPRLADPGLHPRNIVGHSSWTPERGHEKTAPARRGTARAAGSVPKAEVV